MPWSGLGGILVGQHLVDVEGHVTRLVRHVGEVASDARHLAVGEGNAGDATTNPSAAHRGTVSAYPSG